MAVSTHRVEFVALESGCFRRSRRILLSRIDMSDAKDGPITLRQCDVKMSVGIHIRCKVLHLVHPALGILLDRAIVTQDAAQTPSSLRFPSVLAGMGKKTERGDARIDMCVGYCEPVMPRGTHFLTCQAKRAIVLPVALRPVGVEQRLCRAIGIEGFQLAVYAGIVAEPMIGELYAGKLHCPNGFIAFCGNMKDMRLVGCCDGEAVDGSWLNLVGYFTDGFSQRCGKGQHHHVVIVAPRLTCTLWQRQRNFIP